MNVESDSVSGLVGFSAEVQSFFAKITPLLEVDDLLPEGEFLFQLIPTIFVGGYLIMLRYFPAYQLKKNFLPDIQIRQTIFLAWNVILAVYSGIAFLYISTWLVMQLHEKGSFWIVYCPKTGEEMFSGVNVFWFYTFAISKYLELVDTFLLILKNPKRTPMFLHWFHHATMVYCTWWFLKYRYPVYFYGMLINTFTHTNMYTYYALTVFFKPPWAILLTMFQIMQMFSGIFINSMWLYHHLRDGCYCTHPYWMVGYVQFLGFLYAFLFIMFMLKKYFGFGKKKNKKKKKKKKKGKQK